MNPIVWFLLVAILLNASPPAPPSRQFFECIEFPFRDIPPFPTTVALTATTSKEDAWPYPPCENYDAVNSTAYDRPLGEP